MLPIKMRGEGSSHMVTKKRTDEDHDNVHSCGWGE